ncbi:MAG: short-chain dehydrogenase/reductase SDR [Limisphaerales bacterium]|nr:MAG: short-chain dehydrogenase/reductase SDR [Limisphaerales bacterium]
MTTNPVALITGASRGIGRGIALELAKVGHDLVVNFSSSADGARQTAADCVAAAKTAGKAIRAEICQGDVGKAADRERLIAFTREQFGRLDLLVNNAGITSIGRRDILEAREDEFDALMAINLKGPYFLSQLAANWMIEQGARTPTSAASSGHPAVADVGVPTQDCHRLLHQRLCGLDESRRLLPGQGRAGHDDQALRHAPRRPRHQRL